MIDKNGRIGGKINLFDLLIVIIILAVAGSLIIRFFINDETGIIVNEPVIIEFTSTEVNDYTVEWLELGAPVIDSTTDNGLGTVIDIKIDDAVTYTVTDSGETVATIVPDCKSVVITIDAAGTVDDNGLLIENFRYGVGHSLVVFAGKCRLSGKISGIDPA